MSEMVIGAEGCYHSSACLFPSQWVHEDIIIKILKYELFQCILHPHEAVIILLYVESVLMCHVRNVLVAVILDNPISCKGVTLHQVVSHHLGCNVFWAAGQYPLPVAIQHQSHPNLSCTRLQFSARCRTHCPEQFYQDKNKRISMYCFVSKHNTLELCR